MRFFFWLCFVLLSFYYGRAKVANSCPKYCSCDIFENLKRAICVHGKLAGVETTVSKKVQYLDLSFNYITEIEDGVFLRQDMHELKILNVSHNKISQVHINAFQGLSNLKTLDLSSNALTYIQEHWFLSLMSLRELYLRGNNLGASVNEGHFKSPTLNVLDLSKCNIISVNKDVFLNTPHLTILNLAENNLLQLNYLVIKPLKHLTSLNIDNNTFTCNGMMKQLGKHVAHRGIRFRDPCKVSKKKVVRFEQILNAVPREEKNLWLYDEEESDKVKNVTCNGTESTEIKEPRPFAEGLLLRILEYSPFLTVGATFLVGILMGLIIGCYSPRNQAKRASKRKRKPKKRETSEEVLNLVSTESEYHLSQSTPAINRRFPETQLQNNIFNTNPRIHEQRIQTVENIFDSSYFRPINVEDGSKLAVHPPTRQLSDSNRLSGSSDDE